MKKLSLSVNNTILKNEIYFIYYLLILFILTPFLRNENHRINFAGKLHDGAKRGQSKRGMER